MFLTLSYTYAHQILRNNVKIFQNRFTSFVKTKDLALDLKKRTQTLIESKNFEINKTKNNQKRKKLMNLKIIIVNFMLKQQ